MRRKEFGAPSRRARAALRGLAPLLLSLGLGACAAIVPAAPSAIFDLTAPHGAGEPRGSVQVLVPPPTAIRALDTDRIAARPSPAQYAYLPAAVWSDVLPKLLQARMIETLQNRGRVRAAAQPGQGLLIDYQLLLSIRAFELQQEGAVAEFGVKLMDDRNGTVVRSRDFRKIVPLAANDTANIVAALDAAMDAAFVDIARWAFGG